MSIEPGEIIRRGTPITVQGKVKISSESARGIIVAGQRIGVEAEEGGKQFRVDTIALPCGDHTLQVEGMWTERGSERLPDTAIPFIVVDTAADLPADLIVRHAARLRVGELDIERLGMSDRGEGPYVDVFKAEDRRSRQPQQLAFDNNGKPMDLDRQLAALAERRRKRFGAIHPTLHEAMDATDEEAPLPVAVWLRVPDVPLPDKPATRALRRRPAGEVETREQWRAVASKFVDESRRHGLELERSDEAAPVLFGRVAAGQIAKMANRADVAAVFLYEPEGFVDLDDSIAIANADDAACRGCDGRGRQRRRLRGGPR